MKNTIFKKRHKGHQVDKEALVEVNRLLGDQKLKRDELIEYLHLLQDHFGCLYEKHLVALANIMHLTPVEVYEVASFYHHFDVIKAGDDPLPAITVRVCQSMSCQMAGSKGLLKTLTNKYGNDVRIQPVPCVGMCQKSPTVVVGKNEISRATITAIDAAIRGKEVQAKKITEYVNYDAYVAAGGYALLTKLYRDEIATDTIISELKAASLRGLGGAGFPTGAKWEIVAKETSAKILVANLDEGEPGTLKDRVYLKENPHQFLEGMLIAAKTVGCEACYIYLRDEYPACHALLKEAIQHLTEKSTLALPPIHLRRGAGAYICGEESALIESLEGKRGMPRLRPPYVASVGLFGQPTLVNNFETLYWIPVLLAKGADWFNSQGVNDRKGFRSYSISGRVKNPGVYLAPAGTTIKTLIDDYCGGMLDGHQFYGYFPGGASGGILPATLDNIPLDFDTLQEYGCFIGSAAIIVFSHEDSVRELALNAMTFFKNESCGQCTPCSVGTEKACQLMAEKSWNLPLLDDLATVMRDASICGLGQAAPNPMLSIIKYFPSEID